MTAVGNDGFRIAHLSDLHCGGPHFVPALLDRAISEINDLEPDLVVCSGDLTTSGFKPEYVQARAYLDRIECESFVVVPGNHDARNVGYVHFEEMFGERNSVRQVGSVTVVAIDSTGSPTSTTVKSVVAVTRGSRSSSRRRPTYGSSSFTTICCRCRERAASATSSTTRATRSSACSGGCRPGPCGHKHVPYAWRLEDMFIVNTGTVSSLRLRGNTRPCYNVVEIDGSQVEVGDAIRTTDRT